MKRLLPAILLACLSASSAAAGHQWHVYFGCYTGPKTGSKGIMVAKFDSATGSLSEPVLAAETGSPSFLAIHPDGKHLYAVGEGQRDGFLGGPVSAFSINQPDGTLKLINQTDSKGGGPCHISLDATGRMAMVANYGGGSVASYAIKPDGSLGDAASFIQHEGSSVNPQRQTGPHAHSMNRSPDNRYAFACDLGLDKVLTYKIDPAAGTLTSIGFTVTPPGAGPRHFAFHPGGKFAFVNNEMLMSVSTYAYAADSGALTLVDTVSTLPPADQGKPGFSTAETVVHPDGKTVYVSNRTHDTLAVLSCDPATGKLTLIQNAPAEGRTPRNFCLDPTGRWLIAAHQDSGTAALFKVDPTTGKLEFTGTKIKAGGAVCVRFLAAE
jgi:6-phosphogluconolactonase